MAQNQKDSLEAIHRLFGFSILSLSRSFNQRKNSKSSQKKGSLIWLSDRSMWKLDAQILLRPTINGT
jgi:hypothetical protein